MTGAGVQLTPEMEEQLALASVDTRFFAKLFMPEVFDAPFNALHKEIFTRIDGDSQKVVIAAPRGIGKTSIIRAFVMREILFRRVHFVVYVSHTATLAEMQTENIKAELQGNELIRKLFGKVDVNYVSPDVDDSFSKKSWVAYGSTLVLPRGSGQQVRGLNWRGRRPDLIIVDDLEDKGELRSEENRYRLRSWFFGDLLKSVNRFSKDWRVVYIDTLKHEDALLQHLLDSDDWDSISLAICDEELRSFDPNFITDEELRQEYEDAVEKGVQSTFFMEYMNKPVGGDDAPFRQSDFRYYDEGEEWFHDMRMRNEIEFVILWDPARVTEEGSADTAIVVAGVDLVGNRIFFQDVIKDKLHPEEQYEHVFLLAQRYNVRVIGVEDEGLKEFITYPFTNEMIRRRRMYELVLLKPRKGRGSANDKAQRVAALIPYYRQGLIYHNRRVAYLLEQQLLSFPKSKRWDVMDAFAYIVQLLDEGMRYFYPTDIAEDPEDIEKEYEELKALDEPALQYEGIV